MLPKSIDEWPEYWRELYKERAGIMEYDGGIDRVTAEREAETLVRELYALEKRDQG